MIPGIVLAAGASTRMGQVKMLLPFGGGTILEASAAPLLAAGLSPVVVVLGYEADRVGACLPVDPRLHVIVNPEWSAGLSSSLRRGLDACGEAEAVLVALGDQPGVDPELARRLVAAHEAGAPLAVPVHAGRVGHPVLFARALWDELRAVEGDSPGREVILRHWDEAVQIPARPLRDVDTPANYLSLLAGEEVPEGEGFEVPRGGRGATS